MASDTKDVPREQWYTGDAGLDQSDFDRFTDEERESFYRAYAKTHGPDPVTGKHTPYGPFFFAEHGQPGHMKRYRSMVTDLLNTDPKGDLSFYPIFVGELVWYCRGGFTEGVRYAIVMANRVGDRTGFTKAECVEAIALAFWWCGSRGTREIQEALRGSEWTEPEERVAMPAGWAADPAAFRSGLDFRTSDLSAAEWSSLQGWYGRYLGEVPPHIRLMARYRPRALKAWRNRFENTLRLLPKQWAPFAMIHVNVQRAYAPGIREGVLLAKGFGLTRDQVLWAAGAGAIFGGVETLALLEEVAGDVLDRWDDPMTAR